MIMAKIYGLLDQNNKIKYIGNTKRSLKTRLYAHIFNAKYDSDKSKRNQWIRSCLSNGYIPKIILIEETEDDGYDKEEYYIKYYKSLGYDLVNSTDGGKGIKGYKLPYPMPIDQRKAIGFNRIGTKRPEHVIESIRLAQIGKKHSVALRIKKVKSIGKLPIICNENGIIYLTAREAGIKLGIHPDTVTYHLNNRSRKIYNKYSFKYVSWEEYYERYPKHRQN